MALTTHRSNYRVATLDQGQTGSDGQIMILGAMPYDRINILSKDGSQSSTQMISDATEFTITLSMNRSAALGEDGQILNPYALLFPSTDCRALTLSMKGVAQGATAVATLYSPSSSPQNSELAWTPTSQDYESLFAADSPGLGTLIVGGLLHATSVSLNSGFLLSPVLPQAAQDFYAPGGGAWLHLNSDSLPDGAACIVIMSAGAVPQPLPEGKVAVGNPYSIYASGTLDRLDQPAVLRLFFDPALLPMGAKAGGLKIARWDGVAWRILADSAADPEREAITAQFDRFGIYVLLADSRPATLYMPVIRK